MPAATVELHDDVLHMHVIDAVVKRAQELDRVDALPQQVAGIEVETEFLAPLDGRQRALGGDQVEGDLGGMDFEGELHAALAEHVEDRMEPLGEQLEARVDHGSGVGGNEYSRCQMLEPVNPLTTPTPSRCAARAVFFSSSAARALTPAGLPSPHTCGGRMA